MTASRGIRMSITLVAAVARNGTIGADGGLPWHLPADLKRFKALTMGHPMIMGRRTYESIGRALPGRRTIVVTRDPDWTAPGVDGRALGGRRPLAAGRDDATVMVVGGGEIYRQTITGRTGWRSPTSTPMWPATPGSRTSTRLVWQEADRQDADGYAFVSYAPAGADHATCGCCCPSMGPELHDGEYVFCTVPAGRPFRPGCIRW